MQNSKELLKKANILPKLRLAIKKESGSVQGTGSHRVRLIEDKVVRGVDRDTGKEIPMMKYIVEENGELKFYAVPVKDKKDELHYLIQRLSEIPEGGEVFLEYKRHGIKGYIEVIPVANIQNVEIDEDEPEIDEREEAKE